VRKRHGEKTTTGRDGFRLGVDCLGHTRTNRERNETVMKLKSLFAVVANVVVASLMVGCVVVPDLGETADRCVVDECEAVGDEWASCYVGE
jgi:hypothetical protein